MRGCRILAICTLVLAFASWSKSEPSFEQAAPGGVFHFPADHGKHPNFQTEWWYFTGNVESDGGREWGFQLTFFRRSLANEPAHNKSAWAVRDVYPAHFALTDVKNRKFFHSELLSREGPGLAKASADRLHVRVRDWIAEQRGDQIQIRAGENGHALDLTLVPAKPVVLHGQSGYSRKGDDEAQASYYYSFTRLKAEGTLTFEGTPVAVRGLAWMDHEFGSSILSQDQAGWDWFSLQMDDGIELMIFRMRKKDGSFEQPSGTLVAEDGTGISLRGHQMALEATRTWTSPQTKAVYPSGWRLEIPEEKLSLVITPFVQNQELFSARSTGIVYWEGAVKAQGYRGGKKVEGKGYAELTGYAHSMEGRI